MNTSYQQRGFFNRLRSRLFGERDVVDDLLRDMSRQGAGMARLAHMCALLLIVLFSLGSLVALGGDLFNSIVTEWNKGQVDIPATISLAVSTLLVLCFDVAMVSAASTLRVLIARGAPASEKLLHQAVIGLVSVLESTTYAYMSARYEHPANLMIWVLILARAAAAPLLSVYLSMTRVQPILSRDILHQVEIVAGVGVLKDTVALANNPTASLSKKLRMYNAASTMSQTDRKRLVDLVQVVQSDEETEPPLDRLAENEPGPDFPTGGGSPVRVTEIVPESSEESRKTVALERTSEESVVVPLRPAAQRMRPGRRGPRRRYPNREAERAASRSLLDESGYREDGTPNMSKADHIRQLGINNARANELYNQRVIEKRSPELAHWLDSDVAQ